MWHRSWTFSLGLVALCGAAGIPALTVAQEKEGQGAKEIIIRARTPQEVEARFVPVQVEGGEAFAFVEQAEEASPYWIGVQLEPPTDLLKAHLKLEGGMIAVHVFDDSPAAKAGLKANDIILKARDTYIKEPGDLVKAVADAKETELALIVLHGGKEGVIKVTPVKRPQERNPQAINEAASEEKEAVRRLEAALNAYRRRAADGTAQPLDLLQVKPGIVTRHTYRALELPKDMTIRMTKEGNAAARIYVKRDGKEWEVTEDKLGELPDDVRSYVQQFRAGGAGALAIRLPDQVAPYAGAVRVYPQPVPPVPATPAVPAAPGTAARTYEYRVLGKSAAGSSADSKLDQILKILGSKEDSSVEKLQKELNQLRKEVDELRKEKK